MTRSRMSISRFTIWSAAAAVAFGCSSSGTGDSEAAGGSSGSGQAGTGGTAGSIVSGGTGGASGSSGTGGASGSSGIAGASGLAGAAGASGFAGAAGASGFAGAAGASGFAGAAGASGFAGAAGASGFAGAAGASGFAGAAGLGGAGMAGSDGGNAGNAGAGGAGAGGVSGAAGKGGAAGQAGGGAGGASGAGAGGTGGMSSGMSAGCGKMPGIASGMYNNGQTISITAANMQRRYILNVPTNYDNSKPYKLIIAFHQLNGNDKQMYANGYYHLLNLSNNTTIFVAPNGQQNNSPCSGTGNGEGGCGWPNPSNSDIALADAVVAQIETNFCVDTNRIFATGWSYGGSMSYKTACERPLSGGGNGFVRAIAVYSGAQLSGNCTPSKPVAFFASHGTHDSVLNYSSGVGLAQNFATANGCNWMTPTAVNSGQHMCTDEMGCMTGYPERFCSFNGDHTPDPDNGQSGNSWVYQEVWNFFSQF